MNNLLLFMIGFTDLCCGEVIKNALFKTCRNKRLNSRVLTSLKVASKSQCAVSCLDFEICSSANYVEKLGMCELFEDNVYNQQCDSSDPDTGTTLLIMVRTYSGSGTENTTERVRTYSGSGTENTTERVNPCQNNQEYDGTNCICKPPLSGLYCEQGPRDCSGVIGMQMIDVYPEDGLGKIEVLCWYDCLFAFAAPTGGFNSSNLNRTWNEYQRGFGAVTPTYPYPTTAGYWLGNDNMHRITNVTKDYKFMYAINAATVGSGYYFKFRVSSESANYTIHYGWYFSAENIDQTLESGSAFRTFDRNDNGCASQKHVGFWFDEACAVDPPVTGVIYKSPTTIQYDTFWACIREF